MKHEKRLKRAGVLLEKKISFLKSQGVKITQAEIARAVGKAQPTINMILTGKTSSGVNIRNWSYKELSALFKVLNFSSSEIRIFTQEVGIDFPEV